MKISELREEYINTMKKLYSISKGKNNPKEIEALSEKAYKLSQIIEEKQRGAIYQVACKVIKNKGKNQFSAAKKFSYLCLEDLNPEKESYEIERYYTKDGISVTVYFD